GRGAPPVRPEAQRSAGGDARVLLPQRTGGGVAGIGELADFRGIELLPLRLGLRARLLHQPPVERKESLALHVDLAAYLEDFGKLPLPFRGEGRGEGGIVLLPLSLRR